MDTFNPFTLEGKVILITGASSGIGRGIAIACSKMGATVIISGRNEKKLIDTAKSLIYGEKFIFSVDLLDKQQVSVLVDKLPLLDGIVHCAGVGQRILCKQIQEQNIDDVMNINFKASVLLQTEILRKKKINKGASIIFIASIASQLPSLGNAVYSASKGAVISYANCLALELAPRMIRVNCISPAMVWTDLITQGEIDVDELKKDEQKYPLRRYGMPEDIANLSIYMLSDASSWMTGSNIKISGGI